MGELLGITGAIGSGKTTFANCLAKVVPDHAHYETGYIVFEIANAFNKALKAELTYETTKNNIELVNQVLIWLPEAISEHLHHDVVWNQLALNKHQTLAHPELYSKLFVYLEKVKQNPSLLNKNLDSNNKETYRSLLQWLGGYLVAKISKTIWYDELMRRMDLHSADKALVIVSGVRYVSDAEVIHSRGGRVVAIDRPGNASSNHDVTEAERHNIKPNIKIINNGQIKDLQQVAETMWRDICAGAPKKIYKAVS
jgi:energy-coupling factor transporter ATP-binding protein EcfA2